MGNGEWGMGNREWGIGKDESLSILDRVSLIDSNLSGEDGDRDFSCDRLSDLD